MVRRTAAITERRAARLRRREDLLREKEEMLAREEKRKQNAEQAAKEAFIQKKREEKRLAREVCQVSKFSLWFKVRMGKGQVGGGSLVEVLRGTINVGKYCRFCHLFSLITSLSMALGGESLAVYLKWA